MKPNRFTLGIAKVLLAPVVPRSAKAMHVLGFRMPLKEHANTLAARAEAIEGDLTKLLVAFLQTANLSGAFATLAVIASTKGTESISKPELLRYAFACFAFGAILLSLYLMVSWARTRQRTVLPRLFENSNSVRFQFWAEIDDLLERLQFTTMSLTVAAFIAGAGFSIYVALAHHAWGTQ